MFLGIKTTWKNIKKTDSANINLQKNCGQNANPSQK